MDRPRRQTAFTLLEIIVVIAILAIVFSMALPRLARQDRRELQLAADHVADLLMMFSQRESLSSRPVGIWHDAQAHTLVLMVLDEVEVEGTIGQLRPQWQRDHAVRPVKFPSLVPPEGVYAQSDGEPIDITRWPIATEPGKPRPRVEVSLFDDDGRVKTVVLPSHALTPYLLDDRYAVLALREPVDLDAAGRHREDW